MIIKDLTVRYIGTPRRKPISFNDVAHFIVSEENSKGKTTLLRLILFSLCFRIPMTRGLEASKIETIVSIERDNNLIKLVRSTNNVKIVKGDNVIDFNLRNNSDVASVISYIFGIDKSIDGGDLLGSLYFDQDNGWNHLSSGTVIGETKFNVANAISSLYLLDTTELDRKITKIDNEIKRYQLVQNALEMKTETSNNVFDDLRAFNNEDERIMLFRKRLLRKKETLKEKIRHISDVIDSRKNIESFIDELGIMVRENENTEPFRLKKGNLFLNDANLDGLRAQKMLYESSLRDVYKELDKYSTKTNDEKGTLVSFEDSSKVIENILQNIPNLSLIKVESIIKSLKKEKDALLDERHALLKSGDSSVFIKDFEEDFKKHLSDFEMLDSVYNNKCFNIEHYQNRGKFSGAELVKVVLSYKLAFHNTLCKLLNVKLPLFIDSPGSKELKEDVVTKIIDYLLSYGVENGYQIFISTIRISNITLKPDNHNLLKGKAIDLFEEQWFC